MRWLAIWLGALLVIACAGPAATVAPSLSPEAAASATAYLARVWSSSTAAVATNEARVTATPRATVAPRADADPCAVATERVQQYKAPGAQFTVLESVTLRVAADPRPTRIDGWAPPNRTGDWCVVALRLTMGNEPTSAVWMWNPSTAEVQASDDLAKRLSGWQ